MVFDRCLLSKEILRRLQAELIYVGFMGGQQEASQSRISERRTASSDRRAFSATGVPEKRRLMRYAWERV